MPYIQSVCCWSIVWQLVVRSTAKLKNETEMPYSQGSKSELDRKGYGNFNWGEQNAVVCQSVGVEVWQIDCGRSKCLGSQEGIGQGVKMLWMVSANWMEALKLL